MRRLISVGAASLTLLTACSLLPTGSSPTATPASAPTAAPTVAPTAARAPASPSAAAAPKPTNTPEAQASVKVWVGNTDGEGVYIRKTPVMDDRIRAYPDGTELTIIGDDIDGDDQHWRHVRTPDGLEGYVPSIYTTDTPP